MLILILFKIGITNFILYNVAFAFVLFSFQGANDKNLASFNAYAKFYFIKFCKQVARFLLVGLRGLEPPTSRLSGVRSNHLSYKPMLVSASGRRSRLPTPCGGDEEDRTPDPLLARQVLSQLSYTPK